MDKKSRDKEAGGASSDEDEAFESADEGEECAKSSRPSFATSAGNDSSNSTSKELVGKNDTSIKPLTTAIAASVNNLETTDLDNEVPNMAESLPQETKGQATENFPTVVTKSSRDVDVSNLSNDSEEGNKEKTGSIKDTEDEINSAEIERENEEKQCDQGKVAKQERDEEKSSATERELEAEGNSAVKESEGQNEQSSVVLEQEPCKENVESYTSDNAKDIKSISSTVSTQKPAEETSSSGGGWGWGGWASVLSQATASMTSGLSSVIETVETSLGVPDPEEMARKVREEEQAVKEKALETRKEGETLGESKSKSVNKDTASAGESIFSAFGVSSLTSVVQSTGKELMSGGLDALEFIGKKTMDVLAEGDPGLRQKREKLTSKGPSLSQILKEAKEESEQKAASSEGGPKGTMPTVDLFSEFDKFQGLAHLEALEILSRDSEAKLESRIIDLTEEELAAVKPLLRAVEEVFHIDENDDDDLIEGGEFKSEIEGSVKSLNLPFSAGKILACQERTRAWITTCVQEQDSTPGSKEGLNIYNTAVLSMAELTARSVELFHKFSELLLHQSEQPTQTSSLVRAQYVRKMTDTVLEEISALATHFADCLNTAADDSDNPDAVNSLITTLYLDSSTSVDYLRNSFNLLRPVLQLSSLNERDTSLLTGASNIAEPRP